MPTPSMLVELASSLLLIVDQQPKLTAAMSANDAQAMTSNTLKLCQAADTLGIPALLTEQYPKGLGSTDPVIVSSCPKDTQHFSKTGFSCCAADGFSAALSSKGRSQVILMGQETHVCILQSAVELYSAGYQVFVVEDAVCSRRTTHKHVALQRMQQLGIIVTNYESVLFEWLRDSTHPEFKTISGLLR